MFAPPFVPPVEETKALLEKKSTEKPDLKDSYQEIKISDGDRAFHYDLSWLAQDCYRGDGDKRGYKELEQYAKDDFWGFKAKVYKNEKTNTIVIAYAGSSSTSVCDMWNNLVVKCGGLPPQYKNAMDLYMEIANDPEIVKNNSKIVVVGHSLGGNLAQLVASTTKYKGENVKPPATCVSFNTPPIKDIINDKDDEKTVISDLGNTINYFQPGDKLTVENLNEAFEGYPGVVAEFNQEKVSSSTFIKETVKDVIASCSLTKGEPIFNNEKIKLSEIPPGSSLFPEHSILRFMEDYKQKFSGVKYYQPVPTLPVK